MLRPETVELSVRSEPFLNAIQKVAKFGDDALIDELVQIMDSDEESLSIADTEYVDGRVCVVLRPSEILEAMVKRVEHAIT